VTVTFQISDKRGDAILLVKAEGPGEQSDQVYAGFAAAVQSAGLDGSLDAFGPQGLDPLAAARQTVANAGLLAQQQPAQPPWGQPPVPAFQPQPAYQPPQMPAAAQGGDGKFCIHGAMTFRSGTGKTGKPYSAYFCPSPKGTPNQCDPEFVR
jgi:hypothetical protein